MGFYFRLIYYSIVSRFTQIQINAYSRVESTCRALPWRSDDFYALHNGAYFMYMDLVRWSFVAQVGFIPVARKNKWFMVTGGQKIYYRRPIRIFSKFTVDFQHVYWDDTWFYAKHVFRVDGQVAAVGYVRTIVKSDSGNIPVSEVLKATHQMCISPPMPEEIRAWIESELTVKEAIKAAS